MEEKLEKNNPKSDETKISALKSKIEAYIAETDAKLKDMQDKIDTIKRQAKAQEFRLDHWIKFIQDLIVNKRSESDRVRSFFYSIPKLQATDIIAYAEVVLVIGALYSFANILYILLSRVLSLIF
jgi:hypothetical protein